MLKSENSPEIRDALIVAILNKRKEKLSTPCSRHGKVVLLGDSAPGTQTAQRTSTRQLLAPLAGLRTQVHGKCVLYWQRHRRNSRASRVTIFHHLKIEIKIKLSLQTAIPRLPGMCIKTTQGDFKKKKKKKEPEGTGLSPEDSNLLKPAVGPPGECVVTPGQEPQPGPDMTWDK